MAKISKEKFKTWGNVFDRFTQVRLLKLIAAGYFEGLQSPISIGKEANVFSAIRKDKKPVIIKIHRLEATNFNRMYDYIKNDPRFSGIKNRRKVIFSWVQMEYRNLLRAREAGVRCPTPIAFKDNILVMEFIGDDAIAPKLKDRIPDDLEKFYKDVVKNLKRLYKAGLVHGDLSQFNILNKDEKPVFIDFSQCTTLENPNAKDYLKRDIKNVCNFFIKYGFKVKEEDLLAELVQDSKLLKKS